jgi:uncharacterized SAM-binding protein YcdF (DUF218 family)
MFGGKLLARARSWLAAFGLLVIGVMATPLVVWWGGWLAGPWKDPVGEVLIVLAGSSLEDGVLGESSYWRCVYAVRAWRQGGFRTIVLSGGGDTPAAQAMAGFLRAHGVPEHALRLETASRNTRENALRTEPILVALPGRKVLLTSDYHMFRAHRLFRRAGLEVDPRPIPDARKRGQRIGPHRWVVFSELVAESAKILVSFARGWL